MDEPLPTSRYPKLEDNTLQELAEAQGKKGSGALGANARSLNKVVYIRVKVLPGELETVRDWLKEQGAADIISYNAYGHDSINTKITVDLLPVLAHHEGVDSVYRIYPGPPD